MRVISDRFRRALYAQESDELILACVTLSRPSWSEPVRLVNNGANLVHAGETFLAFPCELTLPSDDDEETPPLLRFVLANASSELMDEIRASAEPIEANVRFVLEVTPEEVEVEFDAVIYDIRANADTISGNMTVEPMLDLGFSRLRFTPENNPGLFP